ncbi:MAG: Gfo/Idh/MocA family oxidoreductase [Gloeomargaritaceae cyanobacterium C42_A2020_066]|nr:Gfo/Idh/MocA family oxidoreductase [Gloeomargaritaceae cyanobacterium C42_A2020_066]
MTSVPPLGVVLAGTGFGLKVHLPALQAHPRTHVVALYHRDLGKAETLARQHGIPYAGDTLEDLLELPGVDALSVATPPFLHAPMARLALTAGKHLILEKPVGLDVIEAQALYHLAQATQRVALVNFEFRALPAWQRLQELLADEWAGRKRLVVVNWTVTSRADPRRPWNWYSQAAKGGGALGSLAVHTFDYIHWLFGPMAAVMGRLETAIATRPDPVSQTPRPVDADDTCLLTLRLADGTPCQVTISAVTHHGRGHWIEVYGEQGTLVLGSDNLQDYGHGFRLWAGRPGASLAEVTIPDRLALSEVYPDGRLAPVLRLVDRWVSTIDYGRPLVPSLREGVYAQGVMDCARASHARGNWVPVPELGTLLGEQPL